MQSRLGSRFFSCQRGVDRRSLFGLGSLPVAISFESDRFLGELIDFSPSGLGLIVRGEKASVQPGEQVEISILHPDSHGESHLFLKIMNVTTSWRGDASCKRLGGTLLPAQEVALNFVFPSPVRAHAWAQNPWFFGETHHFQLKAASPLALQLVFRARQCSLLPGMKLDLWVALPYGQPWCVPCKISSVAAGQDEFVLLVAMQSPPQAFLEALAATLTALCPQATFKRLRAEGFALRTMPEAIVVEPAGSEADYREALAVRFRSAENQSNVTLQELADGYDSYSAILLARIAGNTVATARLLANGGNRERSELAQEIELPEWLWTQGFAETAQFALLPEYEDEQLVFALYKHILLMAHQLTVPNLLLGLRQNQLALFKRLGARELGLCFPKQGENLYLAVVETMAVAQGLVASLRKGYSLKMWLQLKPLRTYLANRKFLPKI